MFKVGDRVCVVCGHKPVFGVITEDRGDGDWLVEFENHHGNDGLDVSMHNDECLQLAPHLTPFERRVQDYIDKELS